MDGYIAAGKIRLVSAQQKEELFTPQSGTPEADGNFVLGLSSGTDKGQIILTGISEETAAPDTIPAGYREKGRILSLLFLQK